LLVMNRSMVRLTVAARAPKKTAQRLGAVGATLRPLNAAGQLGRQRRHNAGHCQLFPMIKQKRPQHGESRGRRSWGMPGAARHGRSIRLPTGCSNKAIVPSGARRRSHERWASKNRCSLSKFPSIPPFKSWIVLLCAYRSTPKRYLKSSRREPRIPSASRLCGLPRHTSALGRRSTFLSSRACGQSRGRFSQRRRRRYHATHSLRKQRHAQKE
jgi:hypothetical protein